MKCPNCGSENKDNAKFCFKCGTKLMPPVKPAEVINTPQPVIIPSPVKPVETNVIPQPKQESRQTFDDLATRPLASASLIFKESGKKIPIPYKPAVLVGREDKQSGNIPDIDLSEVDVNKVTSRRHSTILYSPGRYSIKDMGSMNGTFINGIKIDKDKEYDLKDGDEILFGKVACTFEFFG